MPAPPPTPGCFWQRVWNSLKIKGLSFWRVQKSAQEYEKTADSAGSEQRVVGSEERMNPYPHENGRLSEERNCARGIAQVIENKSRCATEFRAVRAEKVGGTPPYVFVQD